MKKFIIALLSTSMIFTLFACNIANNESSGSPSNNSTPSQIDSKQTSEENSNKPNNKEDLEKLMAKIVANAPTPDSSIYKIEPEDLEAYAFIDHKNGLEAVTSEGTITTIPHSIVLLRTQNNDAETLAKEVAANADPVKWICVQAESATVAHSQNYVLLIMTDKKSAEVIKSNFEKLMASSEIKWLDVDKKTME